MAKYHFHVDQQTLTLYNEILSQITTVTQARYLGVVLSANGILECSVKNRIQMSHASLSSLRNAKLTFAGVNPSYAKMVYRTLIESKMDYATFLCPSSADALHAVRCSRLIALPVRKREWTTT